MSMANYARANAVLTAKSYELVKVSHLEMLPTGYNALVGECGHRLSVLPHTSVSMWERKLNAPKSPRKRCTYCVKDTGARNAKLAAESYRLSF